MTLVGKILTVMILIMSIVFMAFTVMTYATHRNWRNEVEGTAPLGLKYQLENKNKELQDRLADMERLKLELAQEKAARSKALAALEDKARDLSEKLTEQQIKLTNAESEKSKSMQIAQTAQNEMQRLKNEVDAVRQDLKNALDDRNEKLALVSQLRDERNQNRGEIVRLTDRIANMRTQLSRTKLVLDRNGLDEFTPIDNIPPALDGVITMVRAGDLIEVSLGSDEGLRAGHELDIYRKDGSYIGRVVVVDTNSDRAVARIIPQYQQGVIRRGDRVATKLLD